VPDAAILVEGERIADVGPRDDVLQRAGAAGHALMDLGGQFVLPGLWDVHTHLGSTIPPWEAREATESESHHAYRCVRKAQDNLAAGITSLRTCGDRFNADLELKAAIGAGILVGPRLYVSGYSFWFRDAAGEDAFRQSARSLLNKGADHIKLFSSGGIASRGKTITRTACTLVELRAAIEEAHRWSKTAVVHAIGDEGIIMACEAGADCIEHAFVMTEEGVRAMAHHGVVYSPQLAVTAAWNEGFLRQAGCYPEWLIVNAVEAGQVHHAMFQKAVAAGIPVVTGVDNLPRLPYSAGIETFQGEPGLVMEIRLMVDNGLEPLQALQAATRNAARICGVGDQFGTLEKGKMADLIAVAADPLADIAALRSVRLVMLGGRVIQFNEGLAR
jgi:imidazolonepropionase-like amidohydrolase